MDLTDAEIAAEYKRARGAGGCPPLEEIAELCYETGTCPATDGCIVEPDGVCPHGCESWALVLGII